MGNNKHDKKGSPKLQAHGHDTEAKGSADSGVCWNLNRHVVVNVRMGRRMDFVYLPDLGELGEMVLPVPFDFCYARDMSGEATAMMDALKSRVFVV